MKEILDGNTLIKAIQVLVVINARDDLGYKIFDIIDVKIGSNPELDHQIFTWGLALDGLLEKAKLIREFADRPFANTTRLMFALAELHNDSTIGEMNALINEAHAAAIRLNEEQRKTDAANGTWFGWSPKQLAAMFNTPVSKTNDFYQLSFETSLLQTSEAAFKDSLVIDSLPQEESLRHEIATATNTVVGAGDHHRAAVVFLHLLHTGVIKIKHTEHEDMVRQSVECIVAHTDIQDHRWVFVDEIRRHCVDDEPLIEYLKQKDLIPFSVTSFYHYPITLIGALTKAFRPELLEQCGVVDGSKRDLDKVVAFRSKLLEPDVDRDFVNIWTAKP
jgi:hypothetical protein